MTRAAPCREVFRGCRPVWSRIVVSIVGLPVVLGLVWLGGWWPVALAILAGSSPSTSCTGLPAPCGRSCSRAMRGRSRRSWARSSPGPAWMVGGFMLTLALAFLLKGIAGTRQTMTVSVATTVLGPAWVGLGLPI